LQTTGLPASFAGARDKKETVYLLLSF